MDQVRNDELNVRPTANAPSGGYGSGSMTRGDIPAGPRVLSRIPDVSSDEPETGGRRPFALPASRFLNARVSSGLLLGSAVVLFLLAMFVFNKKSGPDPAPADKDASSKIASPAPDAPPAPKWLGVAPEGANRPAVSAMPEFPPMGTAPATAWSGVPGPTDRETPKTAAWGAPSSGPTAAGATSSWRGQAPSPTWNSTPSSVAGHSTGAAWEDRPTRPPVDAPTATPAWHEPVQAPVAVPARSAAPEAPMVANRPTGPSAPPMPAAAEPVTGAVRAWPAPYETYLQPQSGAGRTTTRDDAANDAVGRATAVPQESRAAYPSTGSYRGSSIGAGYPIAYPSAGSPSAAPSGYGPSHAPGAFPAKTYPGSPSEAYPNSYPTTAAQSVYPSTAYPSPYPAAGAQNAYAPNPYSNSNPAAGTQNAYPASSAPPAYPSASPQGSYSPGAYPTAYPATGYPKSGSGGVPQAGPGYGAGASGQGTEPGVAQFQGGIQKPPMGTMYDRAGSSVY